MTEQISATMNIVIREGLVTIGVDGEPLGQDEATWGWIASREGGGCQGQGDTPDDAYEQLLLNLVEAGERSEELQQRLETALGEVEFKIFWEWVATADSTYAAERD